MSSPKTMLRTSALVLTAWMLTINLQILKATHAVPQPHQIEETFEFTLGGCRQVFPKEIPRFTAWKTSDNVGDNRGFVLINAELDDDPITKRIAGGVTLGCSRLEVINAIKKQLPSKTESRGQVSTYRHRAGRAEYLILLDSLRIQRKAVGGVAVILDVINSSESPRDTVQGIFELKSVAADGSPVNEGEILVNSVGLELPGFIALSRNRACRIDCEPPSGFGFSYWVVKGGELTHSSIEKANYVVALSGEGSLTAVYRRLSPEVEENRPPDEPPATEQTWTEVEVTHTLTARSTHTVKKRATSKVKGSYATRRTETITYPTSASITYTIITPTSWTRTITHTSTMLTPTEVTETITYTETETYTTTTTETLHSTSTWRFTHTQTQTKTYRSTSTYTTTVASISTSTYTTTLTITGPIEPSTRTETAPGNYRTTYTTTETRYPRSTTTYTVTKRRKTTWTETHTYTRTSTYASTMAQTSTLTEAKTATITRTVTDTYTTETPIPTTSTQAIIHVSILTITYATVIPTWTCRTTTHTTYMRRTRVVTWTTTYPTTVSSTILRIETLTVPVKETNEITASASGTVTATPEEAATSSSTSELTSPSNGSEWLDTRAVDGGKTSTELMIQQIVYKVSPLWVERRPEYEEMVVSEIRVGIRNHDTTQRNFMITLRRLDELPGGSENPIAAFLLSPDLPEGSRIWSNSESRENLILSTDKVIYTVNAETAKIVTETLFLWEAKRPQYAGESLDKWSPKAHLYVYVNRSWRLVDVEPEPEVT